MKEISVHIRDKIIKMQHERYNFLLISKDPNPNSLNLIGSRDLGIYLRNDKLYCKIEGKEEIEITPFKDVTTSITGIDPRVFFRLKKNIEDNISPNVEDKIELLEFTSFIGYSLSEKQAYKFKIQLSCHDHFLTEEEAEEQILSYAIPLTPENKKKYFSEEAKFINFYKKIYSQYSTFFCFYDEPETYYEIESQDELKNICIKSLREQKFIDLYVKDIDLIISGSYDLEVILYTNDFAVIKYLEEQNFIEGLYLLY